MQTVEELEIEGAGSAAPWWEVAPFHGTSLGAPNFAGVLSAMAAPEPSQEDPPSTETEPEEAIDPALLSYENALRAPSNPALGLRRSASITIRLSRAENAQLRERAAEAGLTVSAYLRSCTLQAEALRAQVKQALAQLRAAPVAEKPTEEPRRWWQINSPLR